MSPFHQPVLLSETLKFLDPSPGKTFIDATVGGGGHTRALLSAGATVLGIDQDPEAITHLTSLQDLDQSRLKLVLGNFINLTTIADAQGFSAVDGILFDFGVSSHQLDEPDRGFSFTADSPLDMRMSPELGVTAADLVNALGKNELIKLFTLYAQERLARPIAEAIVRARRLSPIKTTRQLASIVQRVYQARYQGKSRLDPATKVFQALRIAVNDELNAIKTVLPQAIKLLNSPGRLVAISFHEGEDRLVKRFFRAQVDRGVGHLLTKKPLTAGSQELAGNPRSRSAKLRAFEKN